MKLQGAAVLVTGGSSGLGAATVDALGTRGARVVSMDRAASDRSDRPPWLVEHQGDIRDPESVAAALAAAEDLGGLRIVVNCAGIDTPARVLAGDEPHDLELFRQVLDVNLLGTFNVVRLAARSMAARPPQDGVRGVIVNTSSIVAFDGQKGHVAYAASKAGIVGMTLPLARDLASKGIRVVTLAPGLFNTRLVERLDERAKTSLAESIPLPSRFGSAGEFGEFVAAVIEADYLNGETIRLDGAMRL